MKGHTISAQAKTMGKVTTGGSSLHGKMKPGILKGAPKSTGHTTNNKNMYKSTSNGSKCGS